MFIYSHDNEDLNDNEMNQDNEKSLTERPQPLGEDISLSMSVPPETLSPDPSSMVNRVFKVAFLG